MASSTKVFQRNTGTASHAVPMISPTWFRWVIYRDRVQVAAVEAYPHVQRHMLSCWVHGYMNPFFVGVQFTSELSGYSAVGSAYVS